MARMPSEQSLDPLRNQLLEVLKNSGMSEKENRTVLLQCAAQIKNKSIVKQTAKELGLTLSRFISNEDLELYHDLKRGKRDAGYISKGWEDPGFRIGDLIDVPANHLTPDNLNDLMKFCSTRGVAFSLEEKDGSLSLHMDSVIYSAGFNKKVLKQVLHYLHVCAEKVSSLSGSA
jgi:hypothetical protein